MKKITFMVLALATLYSTGQEVSEQGQIITDRPDQTESPNAVKKGILQIESGFLYERSRISKTFSVARTVYPTNLFRIGLGHQLELRIVNEVVNYKTKNSRENKTINSVTGTENLQLGFKYQLTKDGAPTEIGVMAHSILPTGSEGISNNRYGIFSRVNISHDISDNKNLSVNLGYNNFDLDFTSQGLVRYAEGNFTYTLVYGVGLGDRVGVYVESFGDYVEFKEWEVNMDAGMTYLLSDIVQLDYSFGWGINRVMNYHSVGISFRLPK